MSSCPLLKRSENKFTVASESSRWPVTAIIGAIIGLTVYPDFATLVICGEMWGLSQPYVPA
jgi:hypothetical protein